MKIPFLDIVSINKEFAESFYNDFVRGCDSGDLVLSSEVKNFEENFYKNEI